MPTKTKLTKPVLFKVTTLEIDPIDFKPYKTQLEPENLFVMMDMEVIRQVEGRNKDDEIVNVTFVTLDSLMNTISVIATAVNQMHHDRIPEVQAITQGKRKTR